jgi:hypothetical protein
MNATDRAYRNMEILLARAAGASGPELAQRFGLTDRQIRRVLNEMRATRRGQDLEAAHQLADARLLELRGALGLHLQALRTLSDPLETVQSTPTILSYFREIREVEELLGRMPREIDWRFNGSDAPWLWMRIKSVLRRHPTASKELYDDLHSEFADWVQNQLESQGNSGHKFLGKMSGLAAQWPSLNGNGAGRLNLGAALRRELIRLREES